MMSDDFDHVTRFEVIDNTGRAYVTHSVCDLSAALQDNGQTLKIFIDKYDPEEPE